MNQHRVFVGGISWKADEGSLKTFFSSFGTVSECKIIMDKNTGKSKGYGFITFETAEAAEKVKLSNNLYFLGKMMNVGSAVRKSDAEKRQGGSYVNSNFNQQGFAEGYNEGGNFNPYYNQPFFPQQQYIPNMQYISYPQYANYNGQFEQSFQVGWQPITSNYQPPQEGSNSPPPNGVPMQVHSPPPLQGGPYQPVLQPSPTVQQRRQ